MESIEDLVGLFYLLPESLRPWVLLALQVMPAVAALLGVVKRLVGAPNPERDTRARKLLFIVLEALDWLALNSTPIREKVRQARASSPPPRPTGVRPPPMLMLLTVLVVPLWGCASSLHAHALAADAAASVIDDVRGALEARMRLAEESAVAVSATREEAARAVAEVRARHALVEAAYEALRLAHVHYIEAIIRAEAAGAGGPGIDVTQALRIAWRGLRDVASAAGLPLPLPSREAAPLLGGGA